MEKHGDQSTAPSALYRYLSNFDCVYLTSMDVLRPSPLVMVIYDESIFFGDMLDEYLSSFCIGLL